MSIGSNIGLIRSGTIIGFNRKNGTVRIGLDEGQLVGAPNEFNVPIPLAWAGADGEFIGGYPERGSSVAVAQGQGGEWYIVSYINSNNTFSDNFVSDDTTLMQQLQRGRVLFQTRNQNHMFIDPKIGSQIGSPKNYFHINPNNNILSHNLEEEFSSTQASLNLNQKIKRDKAANLTRNILGSTLDSQTYDNQLTTIGMDPMASISPQTSGEMVRNPALAEKRELIYEFGHKFNFTTDEDESNRYVDSADRERGPAVNKHEMRSNAFSLSLEYPNHLIETIKGTGVDTFGNVIDLNRNILPIGTVDKTSLRRSDNKQEAFHQIRALHRRSLAFHWEINVRKGSADPIAESPPDVSDTSNYSRNRSRFFVDIDKEGQFKINIPASSEAGNVPLNTRYENFSVIQAKKNNNETNPNQFLRNSENRDIFLENFAGKSNITLSNSGETIEGLEAPIDYHTDEPITYGTAFHDITQTCFSFQESSPFLEGGRNFVAFDPNNRLNQPDVGFTPYSQIVSNDIVVSGEDANAGGRSGMLNLDGFISLNVGANTVDRQSIWLDTAGGIVSNVGKDKNNISYAASLDGDMIIQIGGPGIGNTFDSRFEDQNDGNHLGNLQIHVITSNGPMIFKMGTDGDGGPAAIDILSPGKVTVSSQQDLILKSNSRLLLDAPTIEMHPSLPGGGRQVLKLPGRSI